LFILTKLSREQQIECKGTINILNVQHKNKKNLRISYFFRTFAAEIVQKKGKLLTKISSGKSDLADKTLKNK
jgi:hypothetical protein